MRKQRIGLQLKVVDNGCSGTGVSFTGLYGTTALGTKRTSGNVRSSVANGRKADMARTVQFGRK